MGIEKVTEAINSHTNWIEKINKSLICDIPYDKKDVSEEPYNLCEFGKWLNENQELLKEINVEQYFKVYELHKELHNIVKDILIFSHDKNVLTKHLHRAIPLEKYERLLKFSKELVRELRVFRAGLYGNKTL